MKPKSYWQRRSESISQAQHRLTDEYVSNRLKREYDSAAMSIRESIDTFFARYAANNEISLADARKLLSSDELEDFHMGLEEFTRLAKDNPDGRWTKRLNNASYKVRVSRLEAIQIQIEAAIQKVNMNQNSQMTNLMSNGYKETYYRTVYEIQKGIGMGTNFAKLSEEEIERIIRTPWLEQNYSERIWGDNAKLVRQLDTEMTQALIRGEDGRKVAERLSERMGVGYRNARRLVVTEMSHIQNEATFKAYRESGVVQKYEFLATLDEETCKICGPMDGKVFTLSERETGVNYAPLHPHCRCDSVPFFDDEIDPGERLARQGDEVYYIKGDMSYNDWYGEYVG